jgi:hypothetical protein
MYKIIRFKIFESFEDQLVFKAIEEINNSMFENLDPFDSIAGGECHDIALISYLYCIESGFLNDPYILWTGNHAWVEGKYLDNSVVLDIVAVNQEHLGGAFKPVSEKNLAGYKYYQNPQITNDIDEYVNRNFEINISIDDAGYAMEELSFLNDYV